MRCLWKDGLELNIGDNEFDRLTHGQFGNETKTTCTLRTDIVIHFCDETLGLLPNIEGVARILATQHRLLEAYNMHRRDHDTRGQSR